MASFHIVTFQGKVISKDKAESLGIPCVFFTGWFGLVSLEGRTSLLRASTAELMLGMCYTLLICGAYILGPLFNLTFFWTFIAMCLLDFLMEMSVSLLLGKRKTADACCRPTTMRTHILVFLFTT